MAFDGQDLRDSYSLNTRDVARLLHLHVNTVKRLADQGEFPFIRVTARGDRRYRPSDIMSFAEARLASHPNPSPKAATDHGSDPLNRLLVVATFCRKCGGVGLYTGMHVERGTAHICYECDGSGREYVPAFTGRKRSHTNWGRVYAVDPHTRERVGDPITYEEFLAGKKPQVVSD